MAGRPHTHVHMPKRVSMLLLLPPLLLPLLPPLLPLPLLLMLPT